MTSARCNKCGSEDLELKVKFFGLHIMGCPNCGHNELTLGFGTAKMPLIEMALIQPVDWAFWVLWVLATSISMAIGMGESLIAAYKIEGMGSLTWAFLLTGVLPGLAQWLVLRKYISRSGWWILATALGTALASGIAALFGTQWALVLTFGVSIGIVQWFVLQRVFESAGWWVLASVLGWSGGLALVLLIMIPLAPIAVTFDVLFLHEATDVSSSTFYAWTFVGAGFVIGAFAGIITGFTMMLLSRKPSPTVAESN
jgi:hypothetical protein